MTGTRSAFRQIARDALAADPRMGAFTMLSAWVGNISVKALPVIGVVTPQENISPQTFADFQCTAQLQVVAKRVGTDDLEDALDLDAAAIEACVVGAMLQQNVHCLPDGIATTLNGDGEQKIGTVMVTFSILYLRAIPLPG